jgi:4-cresol dehydrogenase (hydroxylating)
MSEVTTPQVPTLQLRRAVDEFVAELGAEAVLTAESELREFRDPYAPDSWHGHDASVVVMPTTVEQVQAVVRIANAHRVPLWTFSQGRNNGYGGPAPRVGGSVLVNLRRMNRVLEINEELAYALVEPGVRFFDLYDAVRAAGHKLWISNPDLGWGSVVGNTLDHGVGYTQLGDHPQRQCGMEVVLASGDVLRTGMGAMEGNTAWQTAKRGFGPSVDSLFMQSNFGIVTKMGVWLSPQPECYMSCTVQVPDAGDLAPLIDAVRPLLLHRVIDNPPSIGSAFLVASVNSDAAPREHWLDDGPVISNDAIRRMAEQYDVGWWNMRFALYGTEELVDLRFKLAQQAFAAIPGAKVAGRKYAGDQDIRSADQSDLVQAGIPGLDLLRTLEWHNGEHGGHLDFSPVLPLTGGVVAEVTARMRAVTERAGFDHDPAFICTPRSALQINQIYFDGSDAEHAAKAYDLFRELVAEAREAGYGAYRTHLEFMDLVADQYDFNDHAQRRFLQTIKDALDPNGILSPGKQGIWPAAIRPEGNL